MRAKFTTIELKIRAAYVGYAALLLCFVVRIGLALAILIFDNHLAMQGSFRDEVEEIQFF